MKNEKQMTIREIVNNVAAEEKEKGNLITRKERRKAERILKKMERRMKKWSEHSSSI